MVCCTLKRNWIQQNSSNESELNFQSLPYDQWTILNTTDTNQGNKIWKHRELKLYFVQPMILLCLFPAFTNQNSEIWTHSTAWENSKFQLTTRFGWGNMEKKNWQIIKRKNRKANLNCQFNDNYNVKEKKHGLLVFLEKYFLIHN